MKNTQKITKEKVNWKNVVAHYKTYDIDSSLEDGCKKSDELIKKNKNPILKLLRNILTLLNYIIKREDKELIKKCLHSTLKIFNHNNIKYKYAFDYFCLYYIVAMIELLYERVYNGMEINEQFDEYCNNALILAHILHNDATIEFINDLIALKNSFEKGEL